MPQMHAEIGSYNLLKKCISDTLTSVFVSAFNLNGVITTLFCL